MSNQQHNWLNYLYTLFTVIALVIMADFIVPGKIITADIINIKKERQQYYNAAGNYHYSYKIITNEHQFSVEEAFAQSAKGQTKIEYSLSRIFHEVNSYSLPTAKNKSFYSLRIISGLALPIIALFSILMMLRYNKKIGVLVFVLQVLLIADLIFLIL